jgi:hypothetical protein
MPTLDITTIDWNEDRLLRAAYLIELEALRAVQDRYCPLDCDTRSGPFFDIRAES